MATVLLHAIIIYLMTANWAESERDVVRVKLTAPPADGEANAQLIALLSKELSIRKSAFSIIKGQTSRNKVVEVQIEPGEDGSIKTRD